MPSMCSPHPSSGHKVCDSQKFPWKCEDSKLECINLPWMSSLNVQYCSLYLLKNLNALWFPKSSNWINVFWPYLFESKIKTIYYSDTTGLVNHVLLHEWQWQSMSTYRVCNICMEFRNCRKFQWYYFLTTACMNSSMKSS